MVYLPKKKGKATCSRQICQSVLKQAHHVSVCCCRVNRLPDHPYPHILHTHDHSQSSDCIMVSFFRTESSLAC